MGSRLTVLLSAPFSLPIIPVGVYAVDCALPPLISPSSAFKICQFVPVMHLPGRDLQARKVRRVKEAVPGAADEEEAAERARPQVRLYKPEGEVPARLEQRIARGPDGTRGFGLGRGRPLPLPSLGGQASPGPGPGPAAGGEEDAAAAPDGSAAGSSGAGSKLDARARPWTPTPSTPPS